MRERRGMRSGIINDRAFYFFQGQEHIIVSFFSLLRGFGLRGRFRGRFFFPVLRRFLWISVLCKFYRGLFGKLLTVDLVFPLLFEIDVYFVRPIAVVFYRDGYFYGARWFRQLTGP